MNDEKAMLKAHEQIIANEGVQLIPYIPSILNGFV